LRRLRLVALNLVFSEAALHAVAADAKELTGGLERVRAPQGLQEREMLQFGEL